MDTQNKKSKIRLYGFSHIMEFPCMCIGRKVFVCKVQWSKVKKKFCSYYWIDKAETVVGNIMNGNDKFRFFGVMLIRGYHVNFDKMIDYE